MPVWTLFYATLGIRQKTTIITITMNMTIKVLRYNYFILLSIVLSLSILSKTDASTPPKYGGTIKFAVFQDRLSLDPIKAFTNIEKCISGNIFDGLIRYNNEQKLGPGVASDWNTVDDYKTWTFNIAESVKFHNGRKVNPNDIKYSLQRSIKFAKQDDYIKSKLWLITGAEKYRQGKLSEVSGIQIINENSICLSLDQSYESFPHILTMPLAWIVPKELVDKPDFNYQPVGCGPFRCSSLPNNEDEILRLDSNKDYVWGRPYLDGIILKFLPDFESALLKYETNELDCLEIPNIMYGRLKNEPGWFSQLLTISGYQLVCIQINGKTIKAKDKILDVLKSGIDVDSILKMLYNQGSLESYSYQPEIARKLAEDCLNKSIQITIPKFPIDASNIADRIKLDLIKSGIQLDIQTLNYREFQKAINDATYNLALRFVIKTDSEIDTNTYIPLFYRNINILKKPYIYGLTDLANNGIFQFDDVYIFIK